MTGLDPCAHTLTHTRTYTHPPSTAQSLCGTVRDSLLQRLGRALRYTYGKKITHSGGSGGLYKLPAVYMCDEGCAACEWDVRVLGGVNPVLINDCMCCAEDTVCVCVCACEPVCVCAPSLLSLTYLSASLSPLPTLRAERGTMRACGSSKVRLRYGIKYVLLLLGRDSRAAGFTILARDETK